MISILLPARGRAEGFYRAVNSLGRLAKRVDQVEVLVRVDDDDATPYPTEVPQLGRYVLLRGPRLGYRRVFEHFNELAAMSRGDWLVNWNDDVEMLTPGWDDLVRQAPSHSIQFFRRDILEHADTTFPCTGRSVYEAMGHLAVQVHADDCMRVVAVGAGVAAFRDDIVFHHYRLMDQTSLDRDRGGYDPEGFNSAETQALLKIDIEKVKLAAPSECCGTVGEHERWFKERCKI